MDDSSTDHHDPAGLVPLQPDYISSNKKTKSLQV